MRALAGFILRGRWSAVLMVVGTVVVPLLFWLSAPALALVTLRKGAGEGVLVATVGVIALSTGLVMTGAPWSGALVPLLCLWFPVLVGGGVLRGTISWGVTLQILGALFAVGVLGFHWLLGNEAVFWSQVLESLRGEVQLTTQGQAQWDRILEVAPQLLTGAMFASALSIAVASLLLARWWQALLFNPGGFRREFHAIRLQSGYAIAAALALLAGAFAGPGPVYDAGLVLSTVFAIQGLAVVHGIAHARGWNVLWLVLLYTLLALMMRMVAVFGVVDVFLDFRRRLSGPADGAGNG